MIITETISYDKEKLDSIVLERLNDKIGNFHATNAANNSLAEIMNSMDLDHQKIQNEMYPELWKALRKVCMEKMDLYTYLMTEAIKVGVKEILDKEETDPIQKPENRPVQNPEDKEKGLLFIDELEIPDELKQQGGNSLPDTNIYEKFVGLGIEEIVSQAMDAVLKNPNWALSDDAKVEFTENLINCKALDDAIKAKTINQEELQQLITQVAEVTDANFAELFVWEVFEMPEVLKQMIDAYNESVRKMQESMIPNHDETHIFINPEFKTEEQKTFVEAEAMILKGLDVAYDDIKRHIENGLETEIGDQIIDSLIDIKEFIIHNTNFEEAFIAEKITIDEFSSILGLIVDIIIAKHRLDNDIIEKEIENLKYTAFSILHVFFPQNIQKPEEVVEENTEVE